MEIDKDKLAAILARNWWVLLLRGIVAIAFGLMAWLQPGISVAALGEWLLVLGGLASVAFGVLLMARPGAGALAVLWLIAAYSIAFGVILVILAVKARGFGKALAAK